MIKLKITINIKAEQNMVERSKIANKVRTIEDYYGALIRHGWLLPSLSCGFVTRPYLDGIRINQFYCPHNRDKVPKLFCANLPPKMELLRIWKKAVHKKAAEETDEAKDEKWCAMLATINMIEEEGKLPDTNWLITALSDVPGKECEIF